MEFKELKERPTEDLPNLEQQLRRELWQAQFSNHANQLEDTAKISRLRRDVAKVKTLATQRLLSTRAAQAPAQREEVKGKR